jgi:peptidoglycan/LPS O-acetylase OafA/YrhL
MGLIKFLLALAIFTAHIALFTGLKFCFHFINGVTAVQGFFMMSGFFMSLILTEKYNKKNSTLLFLKSRFIKLYPAYWIILALSFPFFISTYFKYLGEGILSLPQIAIFLLANIFIVGQDIIMFTGLNIDSGQLFFTSNFKVSEPQLWQNFLLIPQAWALALIIYFYLISPFVAKLKTNTIAVIIFFLLLLRLMFYLNGLNHDPWIYRFFPFELAIFLAGVLSHRIYLKIKNSILNTSLLTIIYSLALFLLIFNFYLPFANELNHWAFLIALFISMPFIFYFSKNFYYDRFLGELSYPIYISHVFIIFSITSFSNYYKLNVKINLLFIIIGTLLFSFLLLRFIQKSFNKNKT